MVRLPTKFKVRRQARCTESDRSAQPGPNIGITRSKVFSVRIILHRRVGTSATCIRKDTWATLLRRRLRGSVVGIYVSRLVVRNFKRFQDFGVDLKPGLSVFVGNNEAGKSSVLEALLLVLTCRYDGRPLWQSIDPYLFNVRTVEDFFSAARRGVLGVAAPELTIEAHLSSSDGLIPPELAELKGTHNIARVDVAGVSIRIAVREEYESQLREYAVEQANPPILPTEYYEVEWRGFCGSRISARELPFDPVLIDVGRNRTARGANRYVSRLIAEGLTADQKALLAASFRRLQHEFLNRDEIRSINATLREGTPVTTRDFSIGADISPRTSWDQSMSAFLDGIPFELAGKGEQTRIQLRLAVGEAAANLILLEEPENHLSHSYLNELLHSVQAGAAGRQVVVATHSAFVINKLGLDGLVLLSPNGVAGSLLQLSEETTRYFQKLPGYDTLRVVLSPRCILVEGPSDELVVQRAFVNQYGCTPLERGVDVVSVGGLAFKRFIEIGRLLRLRMSVVTDNDGEPERVPEKLGLLLEEDGDIRAFYSDDPTCPSLEDNIVQANSLSTMNHILERSYRSVGDLLAFMRRNKTECALKLYLTDEPWSVPEYIQDAIEL